MKKEDLFFLLDVEGFTPKMAEEYFLHKAKLNVPISAVATPCSIAYISEVGKIDILPYLDLQKINRVWGIKIGNLVFEKEEDDPCTYSKAKFMHRLKVKSIEKLLPSSTDYEELSRHEKDFNETIAILRKNGISATCLSEGDYWISDNDGESVFVRCPNTKFIDHRAGISAHVRWIVRLD